MFHNMESNDMIVGASLHVSFSDSILFSRPRQTYNRLGSLCLTPEVRSFPSSTMLDEIERSSQLTF